MTSSTKLSGISPASCAGSKAPRPDQMGRQLSVQSADCGAAHTVLPGSPRKSSEPSSGTVNVDTSLPSASASGARRKQTFSWSVTCWPSTAITVSLSFL